MRPSQPVDQRAARVTAIPGPRSAEIRAREDAHLAPGLQAYAVMAGIAVDHARGSAVTDVDGNTLLDLVGGIGVGALGHAHPAVVSAVQTQVARSSVGPFASAARAELVERLAAHAPSPGVHRLQLYSTGAEAVESALRLAKSHTGRHEVVGFWGGFHGKTLGALSVMGSTFKHGLGPMAPGSHLVPYADCYRCPLKLTHPACGLACVDVARQQVRHASAGDVAAVIVEPMQGTAGNVIPPDDWLPAIAGLARELGALLIVDEMITGFGRTGAYWGADHAGVAADIVTVGKAFGGGFPLSGILTTDAIAGARPWSNPSGSSSSYGGNALGAAAGAAALRAIDDEGLVRNARDVGAALLAMLAPFEERFPFVGAVRGRGMFLAIELVRDKVTREPLAPAACRMIFDACLRRGLLVMAYAPRVRLQPALTLDAATARNAVSILDEAFTWMSSDGRWRRA
jgi:4-aminobutyrate aminotransferase-like enzyme